MHLVIVICTLGYFVDFFHYEASEFSDSIQHTFQIAHSESVPAFFHEKKILCITG